MLRAQSHAELAAIEIDPAFRHDVLEGLSLRPRAIPACWLYDRRGSEIFEAITTVPEYYPSRTERSILRDAASEIRTLVGPGRAVVEFGAGSSAKTPILLSAIAASAYVPIDISADFLSNSVKQLSAKFPDLPVFPIQGDFTRALRFPLAIRDTPKLGFFPGSTIGNLLVPAAVNLLRAIAGTLGKGAMLLIGIDRLKDIGVLLRAYDDALGVTATFNLNLLHRINRELAGSLPVAAFRHAARWNDEEARIEMHLVATRDIHFAVDGRLFSMSKGETIHTENSIKYGPRDAGVLLRAGGWTPISYLTDENHLFSVIVAREGSDQYQR
jgi:L-histidine Nalpha-methyltransferase